MNYVGNEPAPSGLILLGDTNPIGTISFFHAPPDASWKQLNGQALLKASYPDLWAWAQGFLTADQVANPGLYKSIDANTFAVPKLDGVFIRAAGGVAPNVAAGVGVLQAEMIGPHAHPLGFDQFNIVGGAGFDVTRGQAAGTTVKNLPTTGTENRPVNVALVPCVKALRAVLMPSGSIPGGRLVQSASHVRTDFVSWVGNIPYDDTIPQIGEGIETFSIPNYAPQQLGARVRLRMHLEFAMGGVTVAMAALYRSGTPDALAASAYSPSTADYETYLDIEHEFIAASIAPFTYSTRVGTSGAVASIKMNGRAARTLGGARQSWMRIDEYSP